MGILRAILACACLAAVAWGGEFQLSLTQPSKMGAVILNPGRYKLKVQGSVAIFTDVATSKSTTVIAKVEKKSDGPAGATWVMGTSEGGVSHVGQIVIAGADFKLRFAN
jgi:hypothetical protein